MIQTTTNSQAVFFNIVFFTLKKGRSGRILPIVFTILILATVFGVGLFPETAAFYLTLWKIVVGVFAFFFAVILLLLYAQFRANRKYPKMYPITITFTDTEIIYKNSESTTHIAYSALSHLSFGKGLVHAVFNESGRPCTLRLGDDPSKYEEITKLLKEHIPET